LQSDGVSQRRACRLVDCTRSTLHYRKRRPDDEPIAKRMRELAAERPRWGWRRLKVLFKREGIAIGYDRFLRIYRANGLQVRPRRKRKVNYVRGAFERAFPETIRFDNGAGGNQAE
jgi:putative transposase